MNTEAKQHMNSLINQNIKKHGYHVYIVNGGCIPRYAYTIGLSLSLGFELVMAGASTFSSDDITRIIKDIISKLKCEKLQITNVFEIPSLGSFTLSMVDQSWVKLLMLGAIDILNTSNFTALQIVPETSNFTLDTPKLNQSWNPLCEPTWQWLESEWKYSVPKNSIAVTNIAALKGSAVTEATRWEYDNWELFSGYGPDMTEAEIRPVPLGTMLAIDPSLVIVLDLSVGKGVWRNGYGNDWNSWG